MNSMIPGIFSGKVFKKEEFGPKEPIQYGPLPMPKIPDPVEDVVNKTLGKFPYEPNGAVEIKPENIEYLKS